jgi:hypothetical protein
MNRHYIVAMMKNKDWYGIKLLYIGKLYTLQEAKQRVKELNETCKPELKYLRYDEFVVYNVAKGDL